MRGTSACNREVVGSNPIVPTKGDVAQPGRALNVLRSPLVSHKYPSCTRCGVCCGTGPCEWGEEDEYGICVQLRSNKDGLMECRLLAEGKVDGEDIGIGMGCVLRALDSGRHYGYYRPLFEERMRARRLNSGSSVAGAV